MNNELCNCEICKVLIENGIFDVDKTIIESFNNTIDIETSSSSYLTFLLSSSKMNFKIQNLIYTTLIEMENTNINFSNTLYFDLDRIILHFNSLYSKVLMYLRTTLLRESPCPEFSKMLVILLKEYYKELSPYFKLTFREEIRDYFGHGFSNIKAPKSNGDFAKTAELVGGYMLDYFKLVIIQYTQNELIEKKYKTVLYTPDFQNLSEELEFNIITKRVQEISEYSDVVYIKAIKNINYVERKRFDKLCGSLDKYNIEIDEQK